MLLRRLRCHQVDVSRSMSEISVWTLRGITCAVPSSLKLLRLDSEGLDLDRGSLSDHAARTFLAAGANSMYVRSCWCHLAGMQRIPGRLLSVRTSTSVPALQPALNVQVKDEASAVLDARVASEHATFRRMVLAINW